MRENRDHDPKASSLRAPTPRFDARSKRARRRLRLWPPDWGAILRRSPNGEVGRQRRTRARVLGRAASTVLSATEEAVIVVFRKHTRFTLDVCLAHLKPRIPALTRSLFCGPGDHVNLRGLPCGGCSPAKPVSEGLFFSVTGNLLQTRRKAGPVDCPWDIYAADRSVISIGLHKDRPVSCSSSKQAWFYALSGVFWRLIRHDSEQEQVGALKIRKPSIGAHLLADDRPVFLLAPDSS
jgi:hypothetical protein